MGRILKITVLPQLIQGSLNTRADLLNQPNLVMGSEWTLHQEVVQDLLRQWPAIIALFAPVAGDHSPVRYIAVSKAPCVLCSSVAFLQPWDNLQAYAFRPLPS